MWNKNVDNSIVASGSEVSILCSPQLTCRNRCLSYTPFGVGHFFFFNHLIVIHFGKASGVCSASIPCNCVHSNKSAQHCLDKEPGDFVLSVENFLLWTLIQPRLSVSTSEVPSVRLIGIGYVSYVLKDTDTDTIRDCWWSLLTNCTLCAYLSHLGLILFAAWQTEFNNQSSKLGIGE